MPKRTHRARDIVVSLVVLALSAAYLLFYRGFESPSMIPAVAAYAACVAVVVTTITTLESIVGLCRRER